MQHILPKNVTFIYIYAHLLFYFSDHILPPIPFNLTFEERRNGRSLYVQWNLPRKQGVPNGLVYVLEHRNTTSQKPSWNHNTPWISLLLVSDLFCSHTCLTYLWWVDSSTTTLWTNLFPITTCLVSFYYAPIFSGGAYSINAVHMYIHMPRWYVLSIRPIHLYEKWFPFIIFWKN